MLRPTYMSVGQLPRLILLRREARPFRRDKEGEMELLEKTLLATKLRGLCCSLSLALVLKAGQQFLTAAG